MKKVAVAALSLMLFVGFAVSSFAGQGEMQTIEGDVICLIPDYEAGNVKPVVATAPCDGLPPHAHILLGKDGKIYSLQGLQKGLQKIEANPERNDVKIMGRVEGNEKGWILYVN